MTSDDKLTILVTGFGPFGSHDVNASWESVKLLPKIWADEKVHLIIQEVPVSYEFVQSKEGLPQIIPKNVSAVVHVGVSSCAEKLTLECQAHNCGYDRPDIHQKCPPNNVCIEDCSQDELKSAFDIQKLVERVNRASAETSKVEACSSCDPGRYLCDFIYCTSLHHQKGKALFIHVPPLDEPYSGHQMASGIKIVVEGIVEQLKCFP